jgi:hypothetical protein
VPQIVAATKAVTGELALLSATRPIAASKHENHSNPTDESRRTIAPAKWRMTNIRPAT